jgi:hypothetical protein
MTPALIGAGVVWLVETGSGRSAVAEVCPRSILIAKYRFYLRCFACLATKSPVVIVEHQHRCAFILLVHRNIRNEAPQA